MKPIPDLYPPRERATNVALIKRLRSATDQQSFESADRDAAANLHPSLLAELDWMERTMPESQRDEGRRFVNGFFVHHLPALIALRRAELDLADDELRIEVRENLDFYRNVVNDDRHPLDVLGAALKSRIEVLTGAPPAPADADAALAYWTAQSQAIVAEALDDVSDPEWVLALIGGEIWNAIALTLDHPSSRMRAQQWLRDHGGSFPQLEVASLATPQDYALLLQRLDELGLSAVGSHLYRLAGLCRALTAYLSGRQVGDYREFGGVLSRGYGHCARCAMMFSSTAIVSYDPTCPRLFGEGGQTYMPLDFNVTACRFCGARRRVEAAFMFYSPQRHQVIYNCPRLGQYSEDEARQVHRPTLLDLRQRFIERIGAEEAQRFESAAEEFTYGTTQFLLAVQMGTTVREYHAWNVVRLLDGSGLLLDPTKKVTLELTPEELSSQWAPAHGIGDFAAAPTGPGEVGGPTMQAALVAFAQGDVTGARDILEQLHRRSPNDEIVRKNLAAAWIKLGDRAAARRVLTGEGSVS